MIVSKTMRWKVFSVLGITVGGAFLFQECAPVKFQSLPGNTINAGGINPSGGACVPQVTLAPQLIFVPSSFTADQSFTVTIGHASSYTSISINFGDGTPTSVLPATNSAQLSHTYAIGGNFTITTSGVDATCQSTFVNTQVVNVSSCLPQAATLHTTLTPQVPQTPASIAPFNLIATISNADQFQSATSGWYLNRSPSAQIGGANTTLNLAAGNYVLQAQATDTCGTTRFGIPVNFCVASAGLPIVTVQPSASVIGQPTTFSIFNPGNYSSISISFGDGASASVTTGGVSAGTVTHTYASAQALTYVVSAVDSCGSARVANNPVTIAPPSCAVTQTDGCVGAQFCTGRNACDPGGTCTSTCGQCGYNGNPVQPSVTCSGTQSCVAVSMSCSPTTSCANVCGQCGYTGVPVSPVTTCVNDQVCVTGGTTCNPTQSCTLMAGTCSGGVTPMTTTTVTSTTIRSTTTTVTSTTSTTTHYVPTPAPPPAPVPTPTPIPAPAPAPAPWSPPSCQDCPTICGGAAFVTGSCMIDDATCPTGFCGYADNSCACSLGFRQCFCQSRLPVGNSCGRNENCQSGNCVSGKCK